MWCEQWYPSQSPRRFVVCSFITRSLGVSLDVKGEACGNDFHESMQVHVSQCKSMYDGQDNHGPPHPSPSHLLAIAPHELCLQFVCAACLSRSSVLVSPPVVSMRLGSSSHTVATIYAKD